MIRLDSGVEEMSLRRLTSPGSEGGENLGECEGGSPGVLGLGGSWWYHTGASPSGSP